MKQNYDFPMDEEERAELAAVEEALEAGTLISAPNLEARKKELHQIAGDSLIMTRNINIRLTERDSA